MPDLDSAPEEIALLTPIAARPDRLRVVGFALLIALITSLCGGKSILFDTMDPDCFWHLRVAEQLHRDGIKPLVDEISFSSIREPWTPYSWLAELGMKSLWDFGGYRAAILAHAIMVALYVVFIAFACVEMAGRNKLLASSLATFAAAFLGLPYLSFRPVTAAIVVLAFCWWLIVRDRRLEEKSRLIWMLIPVCAFLTNIHFFAIFVPAWLGMLMIGALIDRRPAYRYFILMAATFIACLMTPLLPGVVKSIVHYQMSDAMVKSPIISEMRWLGHSTMGKIAVGMEVLALVFIFLNRKRLTSGEKIVAIFSAILPFYLGRFAPMAAIVIGPLFAMSIPNLSDRVLGKPIIVALLAAVWGLGTFRVASGFPKSDTTFSTWLNRQGPDAPGYPTDSADYVEQHVSRATGHLINEFTWGGYIAWRLPQFQVLLDGRTQAFSPAFWKSTYLGSESEREEYLATVRADAAILPIEKSRFRPSLIRQGWTSVHTDTRAEVLVPPTASLR